MATNPARTEPNSRERLRPMKRLPHRGKLIILTMALASGGLAVNVAAWAGRRLRLAVRTVIRAVRMANDQQVSMWECVLLTSGVVPLTAAGPLRWVPSLDGHRLVGSHLPAQDPCEPGVDPGWRPRARISAWAPPADPPGTSRGTGPSPAAAKPGFTCSPRRRRYRRRASR